VVNAEQGEKPAKFFAKHGVARADFSLEPGVIGKMRDVVERNGVVTEAGDLEGKDVEVGANRTPLDLAFRARCGEMREGYF
jgi:hypothetical protein